MSQTDAGNENETTYEAPSATDIEVTGGTIEAAPVIGISCQRP
jgi:hypothetical protein